MIFPSPIRRGLLTCSLLAVLLQISSGVLWSQQTPAVPPVPATSDQTNARIEELARNAEHHPLDPTIGSGDLIHIDVFDVPDLSRDVRVSISGNVTLPLVPGLIHVGGLTPFQAQDEIGKMLAQYGIVTHPQVSVIVKEQNSHSISVVGAVQQPGVFQVVRPLTVLEALARAGGLDKDAGSDVIITRHGMVDNAPPSGASSAAAGNPSAPAPPTQTPSISRLCWILGMRSITFRFMRATSSLFRAQALCMWRERCCSPGGIHCLIRRARCRFSK
jgi:protein involved in polysaccharide export with SLBB domain